MTGGPTPGGKHYNNGHSLSLSLSTLAYSLISILHSSILHFEMSGSMSKFCNLPRAAGSLICPYKVTTQVRNSF
ncbi:hypothetical protein ACN42_g3928 [Penicillium freii]|uniref:Uncharacterized protein n=1 Tax=Penicillium freii TaxID=48697 RepID=A0A101MMA4_PENFR|nr:hypothetical protein ACN42_g3928 [Penicillium freii]